MAAIDSTSAIQALGSSRNPTLAALLEIATRRASGGKTASASKVTQARITKLTESQSAIAARIADFKTLSTKLGTLSSSANALLAVPTNLSASITVDKLDKNDEVVELNASSTVTQKLQTGDKITFPTSFSGITANTPFFVRRGTTGGGSTKFELFTDRASALGTGTANRVNITDNTVPSGSVAIQIVPQPKQPIIDFFSAFNDVQKFIREKTAEGGSLKGETGLSDLASQLSQAVLPALSEKDLGPGLTTGSAPREVVVDSTALGNQVTEKAQNIASFVESNTGIAANTRRIADAFRGPSGFTGRRISTLRSLSDTVDAQLQSLVSKAEGEAKKTSKELGSITRSTVGVGVNIAFLSALARR